MTILQQRRRRPRHLGESVIAITASCLMLAGCIRDVPVEDNSTGIKRPDVASPPGLDRLETAVKLKKGDVVEGLKLLLKEKNPDENHTTIAYNSNGKISGLDLSRKAVTAAGLQQLTQIKDTLQRLSLNDAYVDDAGMEAISHLANLRKLELNRTPLTDAGLAHITKLTQLRELSLKGTQLTNEGVAQLAALKNLRMLSLTWTNITDDALDAIATLPELNTLMLQDTKITNAGLQALQRLPKLQFLYIIGTKVTASGVARFRQQRRGVQVVGP